MTFVLDAMGFFFKIDFNMAKHYLNPYFSWKIHFNLTIKTYI